VHRLVLHQENVFAYPEQPARPAGPGLTFLPGYGAAYEVSEALAKEPAPPSSA
jgi:hypothetical protein